MSRLPTRAEYDAAEPDQKGAMAYWFSHWPGSEIPDETQCPYAEGTAEHAQFLSGVNYAVGLAQDGEE